MSAKHVPLRSIIPGLLFVVATCMVHAPPSSAQYMYLDANGDGINTAADQVNPSGPTVMDIWLDTDSNRDGSVAVCSTGDGPLTINSYEFSLRASNGTVAWGPYTNRQPGMGVHFPEGFSETEYVNGYGGPTANPPGLYRLGTLQMSVLTGSPSIAIVPEAGAVPPIPPTYPTMTAFGSRCSGLDYDNTQKLGSDWFDTDGLPFGSIGQPNSAPNFSTPLPMTVSTGETASQTLSATDSDLQPVHFHLVSGPPYATVATASSENGVGTGRVFLSPGMSDAGTATAVVGASDGIATTEHSIAITVVDGPNHPPELQLVEEVRAPAHLVLSRALHALDPDAQSLTFAKASGPDFIQVSTYGSGPGAASGRLQVAPELCDAGSWPVSIQVTDGISFDTHELNVRVEPRRQAPAPVEIAGPIMNAVLSGDVNGDGHLDVVTANGFNSQVGVSAYLGDGAGGLGTRVDTPLQGNDPASMAAGDWNEDGRLDLAVVFRITTRQVVVLLGQGNGTFREEVRYPAGGYPQQVRTADLNGDGKPDLAVTDGQGTSAMILLGRGDGHFDLGSPARVGNGPYGMVLADFDRDGRLDLATANFSGRTLSVLPGFGDGTFGDRSEIPFASEPSGPFAMEAADLNEDGILDLAVTDYRAKVRIFIGHGDGTFVPGAVLTGLQVPQGIEIADLSGDGHLDLIVADPSDSYPELSAVNVFHGDGTGSFGNPLRLASGSMEVATAASDLNEDGLDDVSMVGWGSALKIWFNTSGGNGDADARVFPIGENRSLPAGATRGSVCFRMEPVRGSYTNQDVVLSSIRLRSPGTGVVETIPAVQSKTIVEGDTDRNGTSELGICFSGADWAQLFSGVRGRLNVTARIEGVTVDSRPFCSPVEFTVIGTGGPLAASVSPNPLNPRATLRFSTSRDGVVKIRMYDLHGRVVRTLLHQPMLSAGNHEVEIDGRSENGQTLASGIYFYEVEAAEGTVRGRLTVLK